VNDCLAFAALGARSAVNLELCRFRHHLELQQAARLFLLQVLAPLLDVDVVPRSTSVIGRERRE
jgi:hypothetical protein